MSSGAHTGGSRSRVACLAFAVFAAAAIGAAPPRPVPAPQRTPAPDAPLRAIADEGSFRAAFDGARTTPRLVLLLSPT